MTGASTGKVSHLARAEAVAEVGGRHQKIAFFVDAANGRSGAFDCISTD